MLRVENLQHAYPQAPPTFPPQTFCLPPGKRVVIQGRSGSGKSTLLACLAGLESPQNGALYWHSERLQREARTWCGDILSVMFQEHALIAHRRVVDNVAWPLWYRGYGRLEAKTLAIAQLRRLGLEAVENRWPETLSGGQRQRVALARSLVLATPCLLLDEPTAALDGATTTQCLKVLQAYTDNGGCLLIASHDPMVIDWADECRQLA